MYYKISKNNVVVDVLKNVTYVKHQERHNINVLCDSEVAEAILSSDAKKAWHLEGLYNYEPDNQIYTLEIIKRTEYKELLQKLNVEQG